MTVTGLCKFIRAYLRALEANLPYRLILWKLIQGARLSRVCRERIQDLGDLFYFAVIT